MLDTAATLFAGPWGIALALGVCAVLTGIAVLWGSPRAGKR
jgi:hypothetical protein